VQRRRRGGDVRTVCGLTDDDVEAAAGVSVVLSETCSLAPRAEQTSNSSSMIVRTPTRAVPSLPVSTSTPLVAFDVPAG
jgi:hypothetical protein